MKLAVILMIFICSLGCRQSAVLSKVTPDDEYISNMVMTYYHITGELPTTEQGLAALVARPDDLSPEKDWTQLETAVLKDPWQNEYEYTSPYGGKALTFAIRSLGPDGIRSGDDLVSSFRVHKAHLEKTH